MSALHSSELEMQGREEPATLTLACGLHNCKTVKGFYSLAMQVCVGQFKSLNLWVITYIAYLYVCVPIE